MDLERDTTYCTGTSAEGGHDPCAHATDDDTPAHDDPPDDASAGPKPEPPAAAAPVQ